MAHRTLLVAALVLASGPAQGATVIQKLQLVRDPARPDAARVVITCNEAPIFQVYDAPNPQRVVIEMLGTEIPGHLSADLPPQPPVRKVQLEQAQGAAGLLARLHFAVDAGAVYDVRTERNVIVLTLFVDADSDEAVAARGQAATRQLIEAKQRAEAEARRADEERQRARAEQQRSAEEARRSAEDKRKAEEAARVLAAAAQQAEAARQAEAERRRQEEEKRLQAEAARLAAEREAAEREEAARRLAAEREAQAQAAEAQRRAEEQKRRAAEAEAARLEQEKRAAEQQRQRAEEERQRLEAERSRAEQERQRAADDAVKAELARQRLAEEKQRSEAERQRLEQALRQAEADKQKLTEQARQLEAEKKRLEATQQQRPPAPASPAPAPIASTPPPSTPPPSKPSPVTASPAGFGGAPVAAAATPTPARATAAPPPPRPEPPPVVRASPPPRAAPAAAPDPAPAPAPAEVLHSGRFRRVEAGIPTAADALDDGELVRPKEVHDLRYRQVGAAGKVLVAVPGGARFSLNRRDGHTVVLTLWDTVIYDLRLLRSIDLRGHGGPVRYVSPEVEGSLRSYVNLVVEHEKGVQIYTQGAGDTLTLVVEPAR